MRENLQKILGTIEMIGYLTISLIKQAVGGAKDKIMSPFKTE